ncbi:PIN domain-containing protein [Aquamicrobium soli]|uniref:Ribonuclease VapC n=1 Tax=Aquamicrobium soli TaxID=1811518 RepID=A0ABV7K9Y1_9HYPH
MPDRPPRFFDTNVLLYLASGDEEKAGRVERLLAEGGAISVQVLSELANVARRKMHLSWSETRAFVTPYRMLLAVVPLTLDVHEAGLEIADRYQLSVYDGMIVAAALAADCGTLLSQDMHHGLVVRGKLTILNPFAGN